MTNPDTSDERAGLPEDRAREILSDFDGWPVGASFPPDTVTIGLVFDLVERISDLRSHPSPDRAALAEERGAFRTALEMIASGKFRPVETAIAALNDLDVGLGDPALRLPVHGEVTVEKLATAIFDEPTLPGEFTLSDAMHAAFAILQRLKGEGLGFTPLRSVPSRPDGEAVG